MFSQFGGKILAGATLFLLLFGIEQAAQAVMPAWFMELGWLSWVWLGAVLAFFLLGSQSVVALVKTVATWTFPIWVFGVAKFALAASPFVALLPQDEAVREQIVTVMAPSVVSIVGWLFWRFARFQEVARDVGVVLALIVHIATIALAMIDGDMTRQVAAYAFGSVTVTLFIASTLYGAPGAGYFQKASFGTAGLAALLAVTLLIIPAKPFSEQVKDMAKEQMGLLKDKAKDKIGEVKDEVKEKIAGKVAKNAEKNKGDEERIGTIAEVVKLSPSPEMVAGE